MSEQPQSEQPDPVTEEPEKYPGGADAIDDSGKYGDTPGGPTTRDLHPDDNPADDAVPDEISAPDDKSQAPDDEKVSGEDEVENEPPA